MDFLLVDEQLKAIFLDVFPENNESSFDWNKQQNDYENWANFKKSNINY